MVSAHRFFGKGLDINVDVSSMVLIGGCLDVALEVPGEREVGVSTYFEQVQHLA